MNESMAMQDVGPTADGAATMTAGAMLRQMREAAGVHIDMLAGALKVPVARLQALEDDDYGAFPDTVFMRALASSMCRTLKADPAPILALLPQGAPIHLPPDRALNTTVKGSAGRRIGKSGGFEPPKSRLIGIAVVVLLLAAVAVAFLPLPMGGDGASDVEPTAAGEVPGTPAGSVVQSVAHGAAAQAGGQDGASVASEAQAPDVATSVATQAVAASTVPAAPEPEAVKAAAPEPTLVIRAKAQTWVQVRNAAGQVLLQKELASGESYSAEGSPPWSVVIGRADAAEAVVRGQAMDLKAIARNNVARFEVK